MSKDRPVVPFGKASNIQVGELAGSRTQINLIASCYGFVAGFYVPFGGQLYLGEIIALVALPLIVRFLKVPTGRGLALAGIGGLLALAAAGYAISAYANGASASATVSGEASIVFFAIDVAFFLWVAGSGGSLRAALAGLAIGMAVAAVAQPDFNFHEAPWKFGFATPVMLLLVLWLEHVRRVGLRVLVLLTLALVNVLGDYRSFAVFIALVAGGQVVAQLRRIGVRSTFGRLAVIVSGGTLVALGLSQTYTFLVRAGVLGESAQTKLELQGGGSPILMLLGGRNEIFYSVPAIAEHWVVGWGSAPVAPTALFERGDDELYSLGLTEIGKIGKASSTVPTHSFLTQFWIEGGLAAALVWIAVLLMTTYLITRMLLADVPASPLHLFLGLSLMWNVLFSPFGGQTRLLTGLTLVVLLSEGPWREKRAGRTRVARGISHRRQLGADGYVS